jgi:LysM repeat protein
MNTPSPLVPQGTLPTRGKSTFFFKVLMIITVHVVVIGGMLLQGCKDTTKDATSTTPSGDQSQTAATTPNPNDSLPPVTTAAGLSNAQPSTAPAPIAQAPLSPAPAITSAPPVNTAPIAAPIAPVANISATAPTTDAKEYVIASHDTLGAIAHRNGISLKTLLEANAGINPKKLQIGQKIQIPAGSGSVASATSSAPGTFDPMAAPSGDSEGYVVKTGDTLSKIAKANHTSYKKIMALNDLKTTSIRVGQKLKLPVAKSATTESVAAPVSTTPVVPIQTAPASSTTAQANPAATAN